MAARPPQSAAHVAAAWGTAQRRPPLIRLPLRSRRRRRHRATAPPSPPRIRCRGNTGTPPPPNPRGAALLPVRATPSPTASIEANPPGSPSSRHCQAAAAGRHHLQCCESVTPTRCSKKCRRDGAFGIPMCA